MAKRFSCASSVRHAEQGKRCRCRLGFPFSFNCGEFGFLHVAHFVTGFITQNNNGQNRGHTEACCNSKRTLGEREVTAAQHIVGADAQHEHRAAHIARRHGVNEFNLGQPGSGPAQRS